MKNKWPLSRVLILGGLSLGIVLLVIAGADFAQKLNACSTSGGRWDRSAWRCDCGSPDKQPVRAGGYCDATLQWKIRHSKAIVRGTCDSADRRGRFGDLDVDVVFLNIMISEWIKGDRAVAPGDQLELAYVDTVHSGELCEGQQAVAILSERRRETAYLVDDTVVFPIEIEESTSEEFISLGKTEHFEVYHAEDGSAYASLKDRIPLTDFLYSVRKALRSNL